MSVSRDQVRAMAALARLRLSDEETDLFADQLSGILDHVAELGSAPSPMERPDDSGEIAGVEALRPDVPSPDRLHRSIDEFAPHFEQGLFTVPRLQALGGDALSGSEDEL